MNKESMDKVKKYLKMNDPDMEEVVADQEDPVGGADEEVARKVAEEQEFKKQKKYKLKKKEEAPAAPPTPAPATPNPTQPLPGM